MEFLSRYCLRHCMKFGCTDLYNEILNASLDNAYLLHNAIKTLIGYSGYLRVKL